MPQDGANNYYYPPGTPGIPDQTIESEAYNTFLDDLVTRDLNIARPIHRGGTGAVNKRDAMIALDGEISHQLVDNYDSYPFLPGSFYSAVGASGAPNLTNRFAGIYYSNADGSYATAEARDQTTGIKYVRNKVAGVWDAAWAEQVGPLSDTDADYVNVAGDTMVGVLLLSGDPTADMEAVNKRYVDGGVGGLSAGKLNRSGDSMTAGFLTLFADPTADMHAVTRRYVDGGVGGLSTGKVSRSGDTMTGGLTAPNITVGGGGLTANGGTTFNAPINNNSTSTFQGSATFNSPVNHNSTDTFQGAAQFNSTLHADSGPFRNIPDIESYVRIISSTNTDPYITYTGQGFHASLGLTGRNRFCWGGGSGGGTSWMMWSEADTLPLDAVRAAFQGDYEHFADSPVEEPFGGSACITGVSGTNAATGSTTYRYRQVQVQTPMGWVNAGAL